MYIAHTENRKNETHKLNDHLQGAAEIISRFSYDAASEATFKFAALVHDLGKYQKAFQEYLRNGGRRGSVPHAGIGAAYAYLTHKQMEAAFAIDGHHKGLPDSSEFSQDIKLLKAENDKLEDVFKVFEKEDMLNNLKIPNKVLYEDGHERELFTRYLFSALTDADWLDTEAHFSPETKEARLASKLEHDKLINAIECFIGGKSKEGNINELRNNARAYAIGKSEEPKGFYSMTLPTGMGKTLASVSWALRHAKKHELERMIIVLPFTSIIDQTAKELKRIFGDGQVLEHHSNYCEENAHISQENELVSDQAYKHRLATENWDYPIIITTTVQFFESLFSNKPSRCRKVHNIARSVVVFDEVQTLPKELVVPTLTMLKNVHEVMGSSFLFCTATQPAFGQRENFDGIKGIVPLVENPAQLFEATRRVAYNALNEYEAVDNNTINDHVLGKRNSALCIFNTKKKAKAFFETIDGSNGFECFHLSTNMCPAHRKEVIETIRGKLAKGEKLIVSSTQLIEAGVDFDFPAVYREIAPLESIIQSAGRCNREGKMDSPGQVYIFKHEDNKAPDKQYTALAEYALDQYNADIEKLHRHDFFTEYYAQSLSLFFEADKKGINQARKEFNFRTVAGVYRLIKSQTKAVFVYKYDNKSKALYKRLKDKEHLSREDYRQLQQYSVQLYDTAIEKNLHHIGQEENGLLVWHGGYSQEHGIETDQSNEPLIY